MDKTMPRKGLKGQNLSQQSVFKQKAKRNPYLKTPTELKKPASKWAWCNEY